MFRHTVLADLAAVRVRIEPVARGTSRAVLQVLRYSTSQLGSLQADSLVATAATGAD